MRELSDLCSKLKLTLSARAALNSRIGRETRPNVRCPFHTLVATMSTPLGNSTLQAILKQEESLQCLSKNTLENDPSNRLPNRNPASRLPLLRPETSFAYRDTMPPACTTIFAWK